MDTLTTEPQFTTRENTDLYDAIKSLPSKCSIVVYLFYYEGYSTKEIGKLLHIKEATVRTRLVRARKLLKEQLREALLGKVMEMKKDEFKGRMMVKYIAAAVLALVITVVASNGICYAATGETWIGKMKVLINGVETEQEVTWQQDGDVLYGVMEMEVEEGEPFEMEIATEGGVTDRFEEVVIVAVTTEKAEGEDETESSAAPGSDETEAE